MPWLNQLADFTRHYAASLALAATWLGIAFVWWRRRVTWHRKQFLGQVNFSLNYTRDGNLLMRTLLERAAADVWPNEYGVKLVTQAASKTTRDQPFILLARPADKAFVNRAVLNVLSERFADAYVADALGTPVKTARFVFAITFEKYDIMRTLKLRVLMIEEQELVRLFGPEDQAAKLDVSDEVHKARLRTLRMIHELYVKDRAAEHPTLGWMELGVVA